MKRNSKPLWNPNDDVKDVEPNKDVVPTEDPSTTIDGSSSITGSPSVSGEYHYTPPKYKGHKPRDIDN